MHMFCTSSRGLEATVVNRNPARKKAAPMWILGVPSQFEFPGIEDGSQLRGRLDKAPANIILILG